MNPENTMEYNSLSWVKAQLDDVLSDTQSNLSEYIENKQKEHLENCVEYLQLINGTLQMVEVFGAAMLAQEMLETTNALLEDKVDSEKDTFDVLMRAMLQLPDYLEAIQGGSKDTPITLMPLFNDLRAARKEGLLSESSLFTPEIETAEISTDKAADSTIESGHLQNEVKKLRTHFQIGLLDYIRNNKELAGLKRIKAVFNALEKVSSSAEVRRIWIVLSALTEGLISKGIDSSISINMLIASVDRELKLILKSGEEQYVKEYSKELVKNALYYIGICTVDSERTIAVKEAYNLNELIHQQTEDSDNAVAGLNTELFNTVSKGITNDIEQVKDVLELFVHGSDQDVTQLDGITEQLGKIADTYGMLGMGATRQTIMEQRAVLEKIIDGSVQANEAIVTGVAYELLNAESELKEYISSRSGVIDIAPRHGDEVVPASEYREVIGTVISEALKNFTDAKEAILLYVTGSGDEDQLSIVTDRLQEVHGVAMMLPLIRVCSQIEKLQEYVQVSLVDNKRQIEGEEQDTLADVVSSIEYYFEALSKGQPGVENGLNAGDKAAAKLEIFSAELSGKELKISENVGNLESETVEVETIESEALETEITEPDITDFTNDIITDDLSSDVQANATNEIDQENDEEETTENLLEKVEPDNESLLDTHLELETPVVDGAEENALSEPQHTESETNTVDQDFELDHVNEINTVENETDDATIIQLSDIVDAQVITEIESYNILDENADDEIVEIFIEEAVEVLGELHENVPRWQSDLNNDEALADIRRGFHTLKGSGRIIGAQLVGEFSWKMENLFNRIIDKKVSPDESVQNVLEEAMAVLPQLIEQLKGNREPIDNLSALMLSVDAIAEGRADDYEKLQNIGVTVVASNVIDTTDSEVDSIDTIDNEVNEVNEEHTELTEIADAGEEVEVVESAFDSTDEFDGHVFDEHVEESQQENTEPSDVDVKSFEASYLEKLTTHDEESVDEINDEQNALYLAEEEDVEIPLNESFDDPSEALDDLEVVDEIDDQEENNNALDDSEVEATEPEVVELLADQDSEILEDDNVEVESAVDDIDHEDFDQDNLEQSATDEESNVDEQQARTLDIDPVLLKIYYDESNSHTETIKNLVNESVTNNELLKADKDMLRAFHTLYGSARTAGVEPVAELSGIAEKYIKTRQESGNLDIPQDVVGVISDIEKSISSMLCKVEEGYLPDADKDLYEKINGILKQELQDQLQSSWQDTKNDDLIEETADLESAQDDANDVSLTNEIQNDNEAQDIKVEQSEDGDYSDIDYSDIDDELIDIFIEEAEELLESCETIVNEIKNTSGSAEYIQQLQRNMHTLKGGARMAGLTPVGDLTHNLESLVVLVEEQKVRVDKTLLAVLNESLDTLTTMLSEVKERKPLSNAVELNKSIESLMRGEVQEKRAVERFDVELKALRSAAAERDAIEGIVGDDKKEARPHWGERASDVNFLDSQEQVRVRSDLLNNLVNYAGEVNIYHARMGKQISDYAFNLSELSQTVDRLKTQLRNLEIETEIQIRSGYEKESENYDDNFDPLEMDQYSTIQQLTRSLGETASDVESIKGILSDITRDSETLLIQESRISTDLQEGLMRTRMVRFGGLSSRLRRIVRQVSKELGKEVELEIIGETSEVDRTVLDRIVAPLEHMLRNAIAHGIEKPDVRRASGKNEVGNITIEVTRQGADVVINVEDDGSGIDTDKIKQRAIEQGLLDVDADVSAHDVLQFILQSGFSTADEVTQVSGRGVGMDVVDSEIKQLGGLMDIDTTEGQGTKFNIRLPLTLAINQALLVKAADDVFAVPLASIEGVVRITGYELQRFYDSDNSFYEFNGVEYDLKNLGGMLTGNQSDYSKQLQLFPVLLVHVGEQYFALHVDDLIGRREIVVKPVGMQIGAVRGIAGATILADGRVVLILEMSALVVAESLFKVTREIEQQEVKPAVSNKKTIMVVDDSITIRKVTERMLQRYDIEVILAKDGVDATNQLQERIPDLMLLDIEMPRMDGFEVASFVRNDERLKELPIIMITSRTGMKHKEKALEIGVNQYLGKPFQEDDLLSNINEILNTSY